MLSATKVTGVGAQALAKACPKLTEIRLHGTKVTDVGAQALVNSCPRLHTIGLGDTQVTATARKRLKKQKTTLTIWVSMESGKIGGG